MKKGNYLRRQMRDRKSIAWDSEKEKALEAQIEQLNVQLAGCLTAAEGSGVKRPARKYSYGWSLAYAAVLRALATAKRAVDGLRPKKRRAA